MSTVLLTKLQHLQARETIVWCALSLVAAVFSLAPGYQPWFAQDSYQYLSVAHNIATSGRIATSIVHFDVERKQGVIPAPSTTFPPGYPLLVAGLERLRVPEEWAGAAVSIVSFVAMVPLLIGLAERTGLSVPLVRAALFLWIVNSQVRHAATAIVTEMPFTLVSTGALALAASHSRSRPLAFYCGMAAAALAWYIRYAGLFLVLAVFIFALLLAKLGRLAWHQAAAGIAIMMAMVSGGVVRNILLTGTWRGGNNKRVMNGVVATVKVFIASIYHVLFGDNPPRHAPWFAALLLCGALLLAVALWQSRTLFRLPGTEQKISTAVLLLVTYALVYSAAMIYAGLTSVISFGTRMFIPLVPVLILLTCRALQFLLERPFAPVWRRAALAGCFLLLVAYAGENFVSAAESSGESPHAIVQQRLSEALVRPGDREPIFAWIETHVGPNDTLVAADGQPTAYVLHRNTLSVIGPWFATQTWDADFLHREMQHYGARYLLIYTGRIEDLPEEERQWPLFRSLLRGDAPAWLKPEASSGSAEVLECVDCAAGAPAKRG